MFRDLPHRTPFVLLDEILECIPGERAVARRSVSTADPLVRDQDGLGELFLIEAMAQCAGVAAARGRDEASGVLVAIDSFTVRAQPQPGDLLRIEAQIVKRMGAMVRARASVHLGDALCAEGELTLKLGSPPPRPA